MQQKQSVAVLPLSEGETLQETGKKLRALCLFSSFRRRYDKKERTIALSADAKRCSARSTTAQSVQGSSFMNRKSSRHSAGGGARCSAFTGKERFVSSHDPTCARSDTVRPFRPRARHRFRTALSCVLAVLLFCASAIVTPNAEAAGAPAPKILIAFFSLTGNTRLIARDIQKMTGGDLFEIRPVHSYGPDFDGAVEQARRELRENARPLLKDTVADFESYDVVFVGFPNWVGTMPMPVFSFLEQYDFSGKTIIPFCTHGTSGPSSTFRDLAALPLHSVILEGLAIYRNDVRSAEGRVREWLHNLGYLKDEAR